MAINNFSPEECEYLIQAAAAKRDWPNLVQEILSLHSVRHADYDSPTAVNNGRIDDIIEKASELLNILDEAQFPVEYIWSWMILVFRCILLYSKNEEEHLNHEARCSEEQATTCNDDECDKSIDIHKFPPLRIGVDHIRKELCTFDNEIQIGLVRLCNVLLLGASFARNDNEEDLEIGQSAELAHMIVQILKSQPDDKDDACSRTSFDNHVQNETICLFWNQVIGSIPENTASDQILSRAPSLNSATSYPPSSIWGDYEKRRSEPPNPQDIQKIIDTGDAVSEHIVTAAQFAKVGMAKYIVPAFTRGIEVVGEVVIKHTEPLVKPSPSALTEDDDDDDPTRQQEQLNHDDEEEEEEQKNEKDLRDYVGISDKSVKTTDSIRRGARSVAFGVRDFSTRQVQRGTTAWKEKELGKQLIPDDDVRETVVATGKVGVATLGAAALLTETLFETTKAIAQTSVKVASDVANHKYGEDAGKLVQNTGDATGNVLRTITHVGMLEAQVLTKVIAKNTAKNEVAIGKGDDDEKDPVLALKDIVLKKKLVISNGQSDQETSGNGTTTSSQHQVDRSIMQQELKREKKEPMPTRDYDDCSC